MISFRHKGNFSKATKYLGKIRGKTLLGVMKSGKMKSL